MSEEEDLGLLVLGPTFRLRTRMDFMKSLRIPGNYFLFQPNHEVDNSRNNWIWSFSDATFTVVDPLRGPTLVPALIAAQDPPTPPPSNHPPPILRSLSVVVLLVISSSRRNRKQKVRIERTSVRTSCFRL